MKVNKTGKERFLEMFERVNKTKIVEKKLVEKDNNTTINEWGIQVKPSRINESAINEEFPVGTKVKVADGSGLDSNKIGVIIDPSQIKTDGSGVPDITGHYKPVDWSRESAVQYEDGDINTMFNDRLMPLNNETFDVPKDGKGGDDVYLNKGNVTDVLKQTKKDDGMSNYPVEDKLKTDDPSIKGLKGDRLPFKEEDDQDVADVESEESGEIEAEVGDEPTPNDGDIGGEIEAELSGDEEDYNAKLDNELIDDRFGDIEGVDIPTNASDEIEGGLADTSSPSEFDSEQIIKGMEVEMEHSDDPKIALEIAMDHLKEDPTYYGIGNEDPEAAAHAGAAEDAEEVSVHDSSVGDETPTDDSGLEKEVLFGKMDTVGEMGTDVQPEDLEFSYEPKNVQEFNFAGEETAYYDSKYQEDDDARKEELLAKGEMTTDDEKAELAQLLGIDPAQQDDNTSVQIGQ